MDRKNLEEVNWAKIKEVENKDLHFNPFVMFFVHDLFFFQYSVFLKEKSCLI